MRGARAQTLQSSLTLHLCVCSSLRRSAGQSGGSRGGGGARLRGRCARANVYRVFLQGKREEKRVKVRMSRDVAGRACSEESSAVMTVTPSRIMMPVNHSRVSVSVLTTEGVPRT